MQHRIWRLAPGPGDLVALIHRRMRPTIIVLGVSLAIVLGSALMITRDPVAVSFPIDMKPGATRSSTFRADYDGLHIVGLVADGGDSKRPHCILGGDAPTK